MKTVQLMLKKEAGARAFVFFTPYRPWLLEKDLAFFDLAREAGFVVEKTFEKVMERVMFEEDPGVSFFFFFLSLYFASFLFARCVELVVWMGTDCDRMSC